MKKITVIFLISFFSQSSFCRAQDKDSLLRILKVGAQDKKTARACGALANAISWNRPDSILYYGQQAFALGEKLNYDTARFLGYSAIAISYYVTSNYKKGIEAGMQAYRIAQKNTNENWEASISNSLGFIYTSAGKYREAIPFLEVSIKYDRKKNLRRGLSSALNNLANAHMLLKEIKQSLVYRTEAIALRKELNLISALGDSYNDLGETYVLLNNTDSAFTYFTKSFAIKQKLNDVEMMAVSGQNLGKTLRLKKNYNEALKYLGIAERCSKEINSNQYLFQIYLEIGLCYKAMGKADEAYGFLEKHIQYKDSVINIESRKQLNELTEQFQSEKKTLEIESLKKEKLKDILLGNERDKRKNTVLFFSAFILLAIGVYTILLFKRFKLTKAQNIIIEAQKQLVEEKQREILDSIHYAKRIQQSLLPTHKYIRARLDRLQQK